MKYCKNCGTELAEGAGFCEKCGNPVGQMSKQGSGKKKWVLAISSGVVILAVAIVGGLFAMGVIGGKDKVVQTSTGTVDIQKTPSVTGEAVGGTEELEGSKQKDTSDNGNAEDMAWEAYVAYKAYIAAGKNSVNYEGDSDEEDSEIEDDNCYALIYLDSDDYPELVVWYARARSGGCLYTYKNGEVIKTEIDGVTCFSYREREGYVYHYFNESGIFNEYMSCLEGSYARELYSFEGDVDDKGKGVDKIAEELGISAGEWRDELDSGWSGPSNGGYCDTIDEAYTQLLSRNKEKERN